MVVETYKDFIDVNEKNITWSKFLNYYIAKMKCDRKDATKNCKVYWNNYKISKLQKLLATNT